MQILLPISLTVTEYIWIVCNISAMHSYVANKVPKLWPLLLNYWCKNMYKYILKSRTSKHSKIRNNIFIGKFYFTPEINFTEQICSITNLCLFIHTCLHSENIIKLLCIEILIKIHISIITVSKILIQWYAFMRIPTKMHC